MKNIKNIIISNTEPSTDSIWIQGDGTSVLFKIFFNGSWRVINNFDTSDLENSINKKLGEKQNKQDSLLTTPDKTIVGAINILDKEIETNIDDIATIKTDYAKKIEIPKSTSQLENDSNFITEIPSDLVTEQELLNKNYVTQPNLESALNLKQDVIIAGDGLSIKNNTISITLDHTIFKVVTALPDKPETNDLNKIFLVLSETKAAPSENLYTEYLWVNNKWEPLGTYSSTVDLTPYLTKEEATQKYEPKFNHNSAFNKNFGTTAGTVCEGNDSRLSDSRNPKTHKQAYVAGELTDYTADDPSYGATPAAVKKGIETFAALKDGSNATGIWPIKVRSLEGLPTNGRLASANLPIKNECSLEMFSATSKLIEGKPSGDGTILNFNYPNASGYAQQLFIAEASNPTVKRIQWRGMDRGQWSEWKSVLFEDGAIDAAKYIKPDTTIISNCIGKTVKEIKNNLLNLIQTIPTCVGYNITIPENLIKNWNNEESVIEPSSLYSMTKLSGGYEGNQYSEFILSQFNYPATRLKTVGTYEGRFGNIRTLAYTSDNVASASKLETTRNIFGQPFDGTADVTGDATIANLTVTGTLTAPVLGDINTALTKILGE